MQKKLWSLFIVTALFFGFHSAQAIMVAPYFNITINKVATGGDDNFHFNIKASPANGGAVYTNEQIDIQTINGFGTYLYYGATGNGDHYYITEDKLDGWQNVSVICNSDNPNITTSLVAGGVSMVAQPYSSIECTFTNTKQNLKTPVLIVPGILGTDIKKGEKKLWLDLDTMKITIGDNFMDSLQFNTDLIPSDINLIVGDVIGLATTTIIIPISYDYTSGLIQEFENQGYSEGNSATSTLFTFPYDWRYGVGGVFDNGETNVDALKQKIDDIRADTGSDKVDIVAHSTGGLLVKEYAMKYPNDNHIGKAIFVGVPNLGAPKAIKTLLQGDNFNIPFLNDAEMKKISANLPVSYELAPSAKYISQNGSFITVVKDNGPILGQTIEDLNFNQTKDFLISDHGLNLQGLNQAQNIHSTSFDNFDIRNTGVDLYSIVGCQSATLGGIREYRNSRGETAYYLPNEITGDGTVPTVSASDAPLDPAKIFYAIKADHGKMLSADGIRQEIVNIITGASLNVGSKIITQSALNSNPSKCELHGHWFGIFSPVSIELTDQNGNRAEVAEDGSIQNNIPGADYQIIGDHKFVFVPTDEGQQYAINLKGTADGSFTLKDETISSNSTIQTAIWKNVPVAVNSTGQISIETGDGSSSTVSSLLFDQNGDGQLQNIEPTIVAVGELPDEDIMPVDSTITPSSVIADIELAYSNGWLKDKKTKEKLIKEIKAMVKVEKKIEKIKTKVKGKNIEKKVTKLETKIDRVLAKALETELKLYNKGKILTDEGFNLIKNDIESLISAY